LTVVSSRSVLCPLLRSNVLTADDAALFDCLRHQQAPFSGLPPKKEGSLRIITLCAKRFKMRFPHLAADVGRLLLELSLDRDWHAKRDGFLTFSNMSPEVQPSPKGVNGAEFDPPFETLKECQNLIADAVVPESAIRLRDNPRLVHGIDQQLRPVRMIRF
jgi:hypothetical protein